jgi:predicted ATPase
LLADLRRETDVERIAMRGLDEDEVVKFVTAALGHALDEAQLALARSISRDTEGSPLFVGEILRNLMEAGAKFGKQGAVADDIHSYGIPEGVKEAIGRRLLRLSDEVWELCSSRATFVEPNRCSRG